MREPARETGTALSTHLADRFQLGISTDDPVKQPLCRPAAK